MSIKGYSKHSVLLLFISFLFILEGCAGTGKAMKSPASDRSGPSLEAEDADPSDKDIGEVKIREFLLSPGDEIKVSVFQHEDLNRSIIIPPDGVIFFPIVGKIDTTGVGLSQLREIITEGLAKSRRQPLFPGDAISITVFRHEEYNRELIIPSDGYIFFPNVGDINVEEMTLSEIRGIITAGLSKYIVEPQVMIDITQLNNLARIADPQVSVEVAGFGGQKVFVLGEVYKPGVFHATGFTDLVEILSLAGGPTLDAEQKSVLIIRKEAEKEKPELIVANLEQFFNGGDPTQNMSLQRGDIVFVPRTFISNVDRFFEHLNKIVGPLFDIERGYWIGQNIEAGPRGTVQTVP